MYINPEDGSPCYKIRFSSDEKTNQNSLDWIKTKFDEEDAAAAVHQGNNQTRKSKILWYKNPEASVIYRELMDIANYETGWRYDITGAESMQLTKYEVDGEYAWHCDGEQEHNQVRSYDFGAASSTLAVTKDPNLLGTVRKISATIALNNDYEGGEFETLHISTTGKQVRTQVAAEPGTAIFFPSNVVHRVAPVTKGTRYSIVIWFAGPPLV